MKVYTHANTTHRVGRVSNPEKIWLALFLSTIAITTNTLASCSHTQHTFLFLTVTWLETYTCKATTTHSDVRITDEIMTHTLVAWWTHLENLHWRVVCMSLLSCAHSHNINKRFVQMHEIICIQIYIHLFPAVCAYVRSCLSRSWVSTRTAVCHSRARQRL